MPVINEQLTIPDSELTYTTSRSSGPGGQHVNKVSSRVTLLFDVTASPSLSEGQKRRILTRLATRVNREGVLRVVSQAHRSQAANREEAAQRFAALIRSALTRQPPRRKTKVPTAVRQRRLESKKQRGQVKQYRSKPSVRDE
jgi:ribosome-associated protein